MVEVLAVVGVVAEVVVGGSWKVFHIEENEAAKVFYTGSRNEEPAVDFIPD